MLFLLICSSRFRHRLDEASSKTASLQQQLDALVKQQTGLQSDITIFETDGVESKRKMDELTSKASAAEKLLVCISCHIMIRWCF
jgi:chromosome segregation ATPase